MDPLCNPLTTHPIQTAWEFTMEHYPSGQFGFIDDLDRQFGNGSVWTRTRTWGDCPDPLLTLVLLQWMHLTNTKPYLSVCGWIVRLWFRCATAMIISSRILELSVFTSGSINIFKYSSVLTHMGPYLFPVLCTTCAAFRIQLLYLLLWLTL